MHSTYFPTEENPCVALVEREEPVLRQLIRARSVRLWSSFVPTLFFPSSSLSLSLLLFILDSSSSSFSCQPTRYTRAISVNQIRSSKTTTKRSIRRGQDEGGCCDRSGTRNNGMHRGDPLRAVSSSSTSSRHFLFFLFPNDYWKW